MTNPTPTNLTPQDNALANTIGGALTQAEQAGLEIVETEIITAVPAMGIPVWKQFWEFIVGIFFRKVKVATIEGESAIVIDGEVSAEQRNLLKAKSAYVAAVKSGDTDAIKKALQAMADAQSALTNSDGDAHKSVSGV